MSRIDSISLKAKRVINIFSYIFAITFFVVAFLSVMLQIFGRVTESFMLSWTEELARFSFIGVALFGSVILVSENEHLKVDFLQDLLSQTMKLVIQLLSNVIAITFSGVMLKLSWDTAIFNLRRMTAALRISASVLYFALWLGFLLMLIQAIINIIILLRARKQQPKQTQGGNETCS